tara:strand:+ start:9562 stop:10332 length:771 start_codon:yes stop_codon:yes gene_type:complete
MKTAVIGFTGFVGSNICANMKFDNYYNSKNIKELMNNSYDLLISCGLSGTKYKINKNPDSDLENIQIQKNILKSTKIKKIIHISSIDIYDQKINVNENTKPNEFKLDHYGKNRYEFEKFIINNFENYHIIRLPMLFGEGLKKNVLYDLLNNQFINGINYNSVFQWYNPKNLSKDFKLITNNNLKIVNLISEPLEIKSLVDRFFLDKRKLMTQNNLIKTNVKTIYSDIFSDTSGYAYSKKTISLNLDSYISNYFSEL